MLKELNIIMLDLFEREEANLLADLFYIIEDNYLSYKDGKENIDQLKYDILSNRELIENLCDKDLYIKLLDYKIKKDNSKHNIYDKNNIFNHDVFHKGDIPTKNLNYIYNKYEGCHYEVQQLK